MTIWQYSERLMGNVGYGTLCPIQPVGSLETFVSLHIGNRCPS